MKRRNFLKLLPVGLLAVKFGGLVGPRLVKVPFNVNINLAIADGELENDFIERLLSELRKDQIFRIAMDTPVDAGYMEGRLKTLREVVYV